MRPKAPELFGTAKPHEVYDQAMSKVKDALDKESNFHNDCKISGGKASDLTDRATNLLQAGEIEKALELR
jgi:hypothetical protein